MAKNDKPKPLEVRIILEPDIADAIRKSALVNCRNYQQEVVFRLRRDHERQPAA